MRHELLCVDKRPPEWEEVGDEDAQLANRSGVHRFSAAGQMKLVGRRLYPALTSEFGCRG
jgi:hypothetical protein